MMKILVKTYRRCGHPKKLKALQALFDDEEDDLTISYSETGESISFSEEGVVESKRDDVICNSSREHWNTYC